MKIFFSAIGIFLFFSNFAYAQELVIDKPVTVKAQVIEVLKVTHDTLPGLDVQGDTQTLKVKVIEGAESGKVVTVENDYIPLTQGEVFYLTHTVDKLESFDAYSVAGPNRIPALTFFFGLFIVCIIFFGGKQGIRGFLSLLLSLFFIVYMLLPGLIHGYSPVLVSIGVASLIIIIGSYITHGFNRTTTAAVAGMLTTTIFTGVLAYIAIHVTQLTGFATEESTYLNFNMKGHMDFLGLLFGGMVIGLLGILYDAAIGQAVSVDELHQVGPHLARGVIYKRALRIGREHVGALVNTLAIAYVGISLPLLLLYTYSTDGLLMTINQEIFSTEIIRVLVGGIGIILAIPITTYIATLILIKIQPGDKETIAHEVALIDKVEHTH